MSSIFKVEYSTDLSHIWGKGAWAPSGSATYNVSETKDICYVKIVQYRDDLPEIPANIRLHSWPS